MIYTFDTSAFHVFQQYYPSRFPSLWEKFDEIIADGSIVSVREVKRELVRRIQHQFMNDWVKDHPGLFFTPSEDEMKFVTDIFLNPHFRHLIPQKSRLIGNPVADPFVIASAKHNNGCVVTMEQYKPNAAKIPNVCKHYGIECTNIEGFMEREGWTF